MADTPQRVGRERGAAARQRIVAFLLAQRELGVQGVLIEDLCTALKMSKTNARHHIEWLKELSMVEVVEVPSRQIVQEVRILDPKIVGE